MTKKKPTKKAKARKTIHKQKKSAADLLRKEIVEELSHLEYSIESLFGMVARFRKIGAKHQVPIYDEVWEASKCMIECLRTYWEALPDDMREAEKSRSVFDAVIEPPTLLGWGELIASISRVFDNIIKMDEFPDELDISPERKLLNPGENHDS